MPDDAQIRKSAKPPRPPLNYENTRKTPCAEDSESAQEENGSNIPSEVDAPEGVGVLDGTLDPDVLVKGHMSVNTRSRIPDEVLGLCNGPTLWGETGARNGDNGEGPSGSKPPRNRYRDDSTADLEDLAKIRGELEIEVREKARINIQLSRLHDQVRAQDRHCQMLVRELQDQRQSFEIRAAKQQAEQEVEKWHAQEDAEANKDAASARILALESQLGLLVEEKKQFILEIEQRQLSQADLDRRNRLAEQHNRQERQTRELDVRLWREWGEENERKLNAYEEKIRMRDAQISSREKRDAKSLRILNACADLQKRQILALKEQLQGNMNRAITSVPDVDVDPNDLMKIIDNVNQVITAFMELLPSPEGNLVFPGVDINDMAYHDSLLADLHISNDSVGLGNPTSSSLSYPSPLSSQSSSDSSDSSDLSDQGKAFLREHQGRALIQWEKEKQAEQSAQAEQRAKERQAAEIIKREEQKKRTAEEARLEELRPCNKRAKMSDQEMHLIVNGLPGGFPEEPPKPQPKRQPKREKPLPQPRIQLTPEQLAVAHRIGRCRDRRRARRGIGPSRRQRRQQKRENRRAWELQSQGWPHLMSPRFRPRAQRAQPTERRPGVISEVDGRHHTRPVIQSLRAGPCVLVCTLTIMAAAYVIACWRLWLYEQEFLDANDVPPNMQDRIRAEAQSWEWMRILEYELLKGRDRSRLG